MLARGEGRAHTREHYERWINLVPCCSTKAALPDCCSYKSPSTTAEVHHVYFRSLPPSWQVLAQQSAGTKRGRDLTLRRRHKRRTTTEACRSKRVAGDAQKRGTCAYRRLDHTLHSVRHFLCDPEFFRPV